VVLGAGEALIQWLLFPACEAVRRQTGKVVWVFKNLESARLAEALQQGEVDVALMRREDVAPSLACSEAWRYEQAAFVPKAVSAETGVLKVQELARLPWAVLEGRGHFRQFLEARAREKGLRLNAMLECSSYTQVALAVRSGRYAGFLPGFARSFFTGEEAVIQRAPEKALRYERELVLAWREAAVRQRPTVEKAIHGLKARLARHAALRAS
jgi:DNA-binding transcriptional LysR family regulator